MTDLNADKLTLKNICAWLASPVILFYALPWLMLLLVIGTVAQKDFGLYEAQRVYFSSWLLWFGPLPVPGTKLVLSAITLALLVKFIGFSPWRLEKSGIILAHLGVLVLVIGGLVTSISQEEGFIAIREGGRANAVSDYHARVLTIRQDETVIATVPYEALRKDVKVDSLPFALTVTDLCENCRPAPVKEAEDRRGLAAQITLRDAPPEKDAETNLSGATFRIDGTGEAADGVYAVMEDIPHGASFEFEGRNYVVAMERAARPLPFAIELLDFRRDLYPGTDMARGFASDLLIDDGGAAWPATIRMNEPLRYKGHTIYQASFSIRPDGEYSVLSVVENKGRALPYVASALIFTGLLIQLVLRLKIAGRA